MDQNRGYFRPVKRDSAEYRSGTATNYDLRLLASSARWAFPADIGHWGDTDEGRHILIAVARYLAAHSPTERSALQTADIARRLLRGGELHEAAAMS